MNHLEGNLAAKPLGPVDAPEASNAQDWSHFHGRKHLRQEQVPATSAKPSLYTLHRFIPTQISVKGHM